MNPLNLNKIPSKPNKKKIQIMKNIHLIQIKIPKKNKKNNLNNKNYKLKINKKNKKN